MKAEQPPLCTASSTSTAPSVPPGAGKFDRKTVNTEPDAATSYGQLRFDLSQAHVKIEKIRLDAVRWNVDQRPRFVWIITGITVVWLLNTVFAFWFIANDTDQSRVKVSDAVLIALLTTTTATVIALFVIVARYFFPEGGSLISGKFGLPPGEQSDNL